MSRLRRQKQRDREQRADALQRHPWIKGLAILLTVAAVASVVVALNLPRPKGDPSREAPGHESRGAKGEQPAAAPSAADPASSAEKAPHFQRLQGRWLRTEDPYELVIRSVDEGGKVVAAYYNPQGPVHVSKAEASKEAGRLTLFVELRDVNYPGCTYRLTYQAQRDQLEGEYFQAQLRETFPVVFARAP